MADAALAGQPIPTLSAARGYFDGYSQARGTAKLIQGQQDYLGSHTFERTDQPGVHLGRWIA